MWGWRGKCVRRDGDGEGVKGAVVLRVGHVNTTQS